MHFKNLSIKIKITKLIFYAVAGAVLLVVIAIDAFRIQIQITDLRLHLISQADEMIELISPTLQFNDPGSAQSLLESLRFDPSIVTVEIKTHEGKNYANYTNPQKQIEIANWGRVLKDVLPKTLQYEKTFSYVALYPGLQQESQKAHILINASLVKLYQSELRNLLLSLIIAILVLVLTTKIALHIIKQITGPILSLAETASTFAQFKNYQIRANPAHFAKDEIGILSVSFNAMLDEIENHARELEATVLNRTRELEESRLLFQDAAKIAKFGVFDHDLTTGNLIWDDSMFAIYGVERMDFSSALDAWHNKIIKEDLLVFEAALRRALQGNSEFDTEFRIQRTTDEIATIYALGQVYRDPDGNPLRIIGINQDITERKQSEQALIEARNQANAANLYKSAFLANMSHEIRTPMNAIIGMTHLIKRTELTSKQQDLLIKIDQAAHTLLYIINDILDFSKIEAGKLDLETQAFSLDALLNNISDIVDLKAKQKGLHIKFSVASDTPLSLVGDAKRISQVLLNLVSNAEKFTEQGEVVVTVKPETITEDQVCLFFSVRDTGIGISESQLNNLFKSFTQADSSITRKYGGTGLGLAISKQLVELMGGRIWAKSTPGTGSVFSFTVNLGLAHKAMHARFRTDLSNCSGKRVLVVDDNDSTREALSSLLTTHGFIQQNVASGTEALAVLAEATIRQKPFELVIIDWQMPDLNGIETSRLIKSDHHLSPSPAILLLAAFSKEQVINEAYEVGIEGFLIKPVSETSLIDAIAEIFNPRQGSELAIEQLRELIDKPTHLIGRRVLLVEDHEINRELALELLHDLGLEVEVAENGLEGVKRVKSENFELVLMDIQMPVMDGLTATRLIRAEPRFAKLPIIAMTAHAMMEDKAKCLEAGLNDHIAKPIDTKKLAKTLSQWLYVPAYNNKTQDLTTPVLPACLPPFDLQQALVRTNGNEKLLLKVLLMFQKNFSEVIGQIQTLLNTGNTEEAHRIAHSLKGVAGTLAANALYDSALALEQALKNGSIAFALEPLLDNLNQALSSALNAVASLPTATFAVESGKQQQTISTESINSRLNELHNALSQNDLKARELFTDLSSNLLGLGLENEVQQLACKLDCLDFQAALNLTHQLIQKRSAHEELHD